jgi:hypothetical protein
MTMDGIVKSKNITMKGLLLFLCICLLIPVTGCEENGGGSIDPNAGADEFTHISDVPGLPCDVFLSNTHLFEVVQCTYLESQDPLSMTQFLDDVNNTLAGLGLIVTDDSRIWIEALGGRGGKGSNGLSGGGLRGSKGYARTATTIGHILDNLLADGDSLYFLIGEKGQRKAGEGGSGGASTVIIGQNILDAGDVFDPEGELVFLIAGGGGGGGGGGSFNSGGNGGDGADSIATLTDHASDDGGNGGGSGNKGLGGNKDGVGGGGEEEVVGTGGIGGYGGAVRDRAPSDWGLDIVWDDGHGGRAEINHLGGGGGGGFGGGGGAGNCNNDACGAGGGAGGSWARRATVENLEGSFLGKDKMPGNDDNGAVVITIETFSN